MTRGLVDITDFHRYFTAALIGASFILWVVLEYTNTEYNRAILFGMIGLIAIFSFVIQILDGMDISHLNRQLRSFNNDLEETIKSRTAEVEDLYNNAPVGYHSVGLDLVFKMMNQTELNWLGYTREQVIGKMKLTDLLPPEDRENISEILTQFLQTGKTKDAEATFLRKDGTPLYVLINTIAIRDESGQIIATRSSVQDISGRRQAMDALRRSEESLFESEEIYRGLFDSSSDGIFIFSPEGRALNANRQGLRMLGYSLTEYLEKDKQEFDFFGRI